jgi:hypothetical protein
MHAAEAAKRVSRSFSCPTYDELWPSSLRFDSLTLDTNHLGGRWPFLLAGHQFAEVLWTQPMLGCP